MKKLVCILLVTAMMLCMSVTAFAAGSGGSDSSVMPIVIGAAIGVIVAVIIMLCLKGQLSSVHMEHAARNYIKQGSFRLTTSREIYLYKKVDRTQKQKDD